MAYTLTFSGFQYVGQMGTQKITVNGNEATTGMTLKNGDVIVFYTGLGFAFSDDTRYRFSATRGSKSYDWNSSESVETVSGENIIISFNRSDYIASYTLSQAKHTINFVCPEKQCNIQYNGRTIKSLSESEMVDGAEVKLKCKNKVARSNIQVNFQEVT